MSKFKIGDKVRVLSSTGSLYPIGHQGTITKITDNRPTGRQIHYLDHGDGAYEHELELITPNKTTMTKIIDFAKKLTLSKEEKLLRNAGLKNDCGEYTQDAKDIIINKLTADNAAHLIELATKLQEEEKDNK